MKRRLVAILVADAVGYSRLVGADDSHACSRTAPWSKQVIAGFVLLGVLTLGGQAWSFTTRDDPVLATFCAVVMERLITYGAPEPECDRRESVAESEAEPSINVSGL